MAVIQPTRSPTAVGYVALAMILTVAAMAAGQPALFVCAAPFVVLLVRGLRDRRPVDAHLMFDADNYSLLEGDEVHVSVTFTRRSRQAAWLHLALAPSWAPIEPLDLHWVLPAGDENVLVEFTVKPVSWGRLSLGTATLELSAPGGLTTWVTQGALPAAFRVLPPPERVRELLPPPTSHALLGQHSSRAVGDGFDFAELRPYAHGDRLRDINWRASARFDSLQVNKRHPERNGEVVLLLDTFTDAAGSHSAALQAVLGRAARAAWSITQLHLASQDRVGLAARGRILRQIPAGGGDRARYRLLEALLDIGGQVAEGRSGEVKDRRLRIPRTALIVALTPLLDVRMTSELLALRGSGRSVVVVVVDVLDLLPPPVHPADHAAYRLFGAQLTQQRQRLAAEGLPITVWSDESSLSQVVAALRHLQRARLVRR